MTRHLRVVVAALALILLPLVARADCKYCTGANCRPVADLAAGSDSCHIWTEFRTHVGTNGVWIEWVTHCDPTGDACTNLHINIRVNDGTFEWTASQP